MKAIGLICRTVTLLTLFVVIIPRPALSDANLVDISKLADTSSRELTYEVDPDDDDNCLSLGELDIVFRTGNNTRPDIRVVLTDPRGRRIGFDPLTEHAWQALPAANGYINCDDWYGADTCRGIVQVCGPISGVYKLEVIALQTTAYSLSISARSKEVVNSDGLQSSHSEADLKNVAIRARSREIVLLNYSRDPEENVTVQLHPTVQAHS